MGHWNLEFHRKVASLLGIPLRSPDDEENI
jgi:hypothetical protein